MLVYRITNTPFCKDLSGKGAFIHGGRWNPKGVHMLYTASNPALSFLEYLAHLPAWPSPVSTSLVVLELPPIAYEQVDIPHEELYLETHRSLCQELGNQFLNSGRFPVLKVPSALIPGDFNFLLNPNHPDLTGQIRIQEIRTFMPDERVWKKIDSQIS
jgi:RES domain-containing protein